MINETGTTQNAARAILQSNINSESAISTVDIIEPTSSGIKCENAVSRKAQSAMNAELKSARSRFAKNERGSFLSFSASDILLTPLSIYVAKYVQLYCNNAANAINARQSTIPVI